MDLMVVAVRGDELHPKPPDVTLLYITRNAFHGGRTMSCNGNDSKSCNRRAEEHRGAFPTITNQPQQRVTPW